MFSWGQPHGKLDPGFSFLAFDARPHASLTLRTLIFQALTFFFPKRPHPIGEAGLRQQFFDPEHCFNS